MDGGSVEQRTFIDIELACAHQDGLRLGHWVEAGDGGREFSPSTCPRRWSAHAVKKAADRGLGSVEIAVCVQPDDRGRRGSQPGERAYTTDAVTG